MASEKKQIQSFNGEEQIEFKQGSGRFNLFSKLSDLWDNYFKSKVEEISYNPPYKTFVALLTQSGENAPVMTILEDTTGLTITSTYVQPGYYNIEIEDFDITKTVVFTPQSQSTIDVQLYSAGNGVQIISGQQGTPLDDTMTNLSIEIRIYS